MGEKRPIGRMHIYKQRKDSLLEYPRSNTSHAYERSFRALICTLL